MLPIIPYAERRTRLRAIFDRDAAFSEEIDTAVRDLLKDVRQRGDDALFDLTERFDKVRPAALKVSEEALHDAHFKMDPDLKLTLQEAAANIRRFHERQKRAAWFVEDGDSVMLGQRYVPMERVGIYVPGGTAIYPSSLLMAAIPAQVAGVQSIYVVSPPGRDGLPHPTVLGTAYLLGLRHVYAVGGVQAIGALAYGTATVPAVDIIVGPGNAYVLAAKKQVYGRVAIDLLAGPSEIVVLADDSADPRYVAADLLSQAEHDERATAILVTPSEKLAAAVRAAVLDELPRFERQSILARSLEDYAAILVTPSMDEAVAAVNEVAPEHLEIITRDPWGLMSQVRHAGSIFLGPYSPVPAGDYFVGTNHVLPTGGTARYTSGLGVDTFIRRQSIIAYSGKRMLQTGDRIMRFAREEGLDAHARSIEVRVSPS